MTTYYLGTTKDGRTVSRSSTRNDFTHAALGPHQGTVKVGGKLPSFSTNAAAAYRNAESNGHGLPIETVQVRKVTAAEYREALKSRR